MYIVEAKRTPIGKFLGSLAPLSAPQLMAPLVAHFLKTYPFLESRTDEFIVGNVISAGIGQNPARMAAILGGLPETVPALLVNRVCGSGLSAVTEGVRAIKSGDADVVLAGGMESMSGAPFLSRTMRKGAKFGTQQMEDAIISDGLFCSLSHLSMGELTDRVAAKLGISRERQDAYAAESHKRAAAASAFFAEEMIPVDIKGTPFGTDEQIRPDTTAEKLAGLKPAFTPDGTVTAGNASGINDGAALVLLMSEGAVKKHKATPKARIIAYDTSAVSPRDFGTAPVVSVGKLLAKTGLTLRDIGALELNEAFAAQTLAVLDALKADPGRVNIHGGAIALGHPIGASGARILTTLVHELASSGKRYGIASLCVGGGQAVSVLVERI